MAEGRRERRRRRRAAMLAAKVQRRRIEAERAQAELERIDPSGLARFVATFATGLCASWRQAR